MTLGCNALFLYIAQDETKFRIPGDKNLSKQVTFAMASESD